MNSSGNKVLPQLVDPNETLSQALALFPLENLQSLDINQALRCQSMLGHGNTFGIWEANEALIPHLRNHMRRLDIRQRITAYLPEESPDTPVLSGLLDEGVLWLTRLALLMRMGPAGIGNTAKFKPLEASTIQVHIHSYIPVLVARGILRRLENGENSSAGFISAFSHEDLQEFSSIKCHRVQLMRVQQLHSFGFWMDVPETQEFKNKATPVRGNRKPLPKEKKPTPHSAIPDDYLAVMGPRVLWLIKDLAPNLIHLLETLPLMLGNVNANNQTIKRRISRYFESNTWKDRSGKEIEKPPFELLHNVNHGKHLLRDPSQHDPCQWPPAHWTSIQILATTLQSAHLWITLLVMAARIGEVATLRRDCVEFARDGKPYANGKTYKPSRNLTGREREWPIPDILVDVIAQQVRLVEACERLALMIQDSTEMSNLLGQPKHLWASLGTSSTADATQKLEIYGGNLQTLATRIGLTPKPGGKNLHPHRFRKTLARLAGLAIDGSQKVMMLLLGHDDVTTTLGYMQVDPAFAKEVDDITRELRIVRGQALIDDMRTALSDPSVLPFGGHGGAGAAALSESVQGYEKELHRNGGEWGVNTARELAVLLTNNGESARLISAHVICTKTAGEIGLCSSKKGGIVASNCQSECRNHIEDKTGRRDTDRVIPILIQHAQENIANNDWLPLQHNKKQLNQELKRYDDIGEKWRSKPEVRAILETEE